MDALKNLLKDVPVYKQCKQRINVCFWHKIIIIRILKLFIFRIIRMELVIFVEHHNMMIINLLINKDKIMQISVHNNVLETQLKIVEVLASKVIDILKRIHGLSIKSAIPFFMLLLIIQQMSTI